MKVYETDTDVLELGDGELEAMRDWVADTLSVTGAFPEADTLDDEQIVQAVDGCYADGAVGFLRDL